MLKSQVLTDFDDSGWKWKVITYPFQTKKIDKNQKCKNKCYIPLYLSKKHVFTSYVRWGVGKISKHMFWIVFMFCKHVWKEKKSYRGDLTLCPFLVKKTLVNEELNRKNAILRNVCEQRFPLQLGIALISKWVKSI